MKKIRGYTFGGLQHKIFSLVMVFILALIAVYAAIVLYQRDNISGIVEDASKKQEETIKAISGETMKGVLNQSMARSTAFQAHIADDLFGDVRTSVSTLGAYAEELFKNADYFPNHPVYESSVANDGVASVQILHEEGVDPAKSETLGLIANMSEIMLATFENSNRLNSCFVATTDGCLLFVNDRSAAYVSEGGEAVTLDVRHRPWYEQAVEAGELIFTGIELDAFTDIPGVVCAVPVYHNGNLVAVVGADLFLTDIRNYVNENTTEGSFLCVVNQDGHVIFSPQKSGIFKPELSAEASDIRESDNKELADFVKKALTNNTGIKSITIDGVEYYMSGAPLPTIGWTVLSVVDKAITEQPTNTILSSYDAINDEAIGTFREGIETSGTMVLILTVTILLLATVAALFLAGRIVKPVEQMTKRINEMGASDEVFVMEDLYRTNDEIEVLAESFETLSKRTKDYIAKITHITAENERIGTELALATQIQADMLPNIFPAFPDRPDFDIYATMTPAKEVGGDFYDFFLIDDTHLGMVMADVSGKGVPAALFMMISKILVQNYAMTGRPPAEVLEAVNNQICSNNREEMFVTVWFGVLDTTTGKIVAANAGHEYPTIMMPNGEFELLKDKHGFVIGGMEGIKYKEYEIQLAPGSKLFLYTDGVPEATDANNELFGTDRMLEALNSDINATPEHILENVRSAVDGFVKEAQQFDDLTMLCLEYKGM